MNEEEMHDVNGGFFGWSREKAKNNILGFLKSYCPSGALAASGVTIGLVWSLVKYGFGVLVAKVGSFSIAWGIIGVAVVLVVAAVGYTLGKKRIYY